MAFLQLVDRAIGAASRGVLYVTLAVVFAILSANVALRYVARSRDAAMRLARESVRRANETGVRVESTLTPVRAFRSSPSVTQQQARPPSNQLAVSPLWSVRQ